MPARYRPNACYTPKNTIAPFLKYRLCAFLVTIMGDIEQALDVPHAHMWRVYIEKHRALWSPLGLDEPPMPVAGEEPAVLPLYGRQHERVAPATYEKVFPSLTRFMPLPPVEEPPVPEVNAVSPGFLAIAAIWNDPAVIARRPPYYSYF